MLVSVGALACLLTDGMLTDGALDCHPVSEIDVLLVMPKIRGTEEECAAGEMSCMPEYSCSLADEY